MKVLYFTNLTVPYRKDFFSELGRYCDLTVWIETKKREKSNNIWLEAGREDNYTIYVLPSVKIAKDISVNYGYNQKFRDGNFDVVVIGTYYSLSAQMFIRFLMRNRISFILNSDGGFIKSDHVWKKRIKSYYIRKASAYLSTGDRTTEYLYYYGGEKPTYIYPFTSIWSNDVLKSATTDAEKSEIKRRIGIREKQIILTVSSAIWRKGNDILLRAVEGMDRSIGIYLVGGKDTDDQLENLKRYATRKQMTNVHFISFLEKKELVEYYKVADLFVLPTREDIWGLVVNEAIAHGLPVITTDKCIAGLELIKDGENGYIIESNNPNQLEMKIRCILSNRDMRLKMANESLKKAVDYTIERSAKAHYQAFIDFVERSL